LNLDGGDPGEVSDSGEFLGDVDVDIFPLSVIVQESFFKDRCCTLQVILVKGSVCIALSVEGSGDKGVGTFQRGEIGRQTLGTPSNGELSMADEFFGCRIDPEESISNPDCSGFSSKYLEKDLH